MQKALQLALFSCILLTGLFLPVQAQQKPTSGGGGKTDIKLYFPKEDPDADNELVAVTRSVKKTKSVADAALRELFKGVTEVERKQGLTSAYTVDAVVTGRTECARNLLKPLGEYFIGVSIKKGVATVNFRPEAECYLQSAAFMMSRVMNPIEATLKQFKSIKEVRYALDGKVITEWDA